MSKHFLVLPLIIIFVLIFMQCLSDDSSIGSNDDVDFNSNIIQVMDEAFTDDIDYEITIRENKQRIDEAQEVVLQQGHNLIIQALSFSSDGQYIASGGADHTIKIWRTSDYKLVRTLTGHTDKIRRICFSQDGEKLISSGDDLTIRIWRIEDGQELKCYTSDIWNMTFAFSQDGNTILFGRSHNSLLLKQSKGVTLTEAWNAEQVDVSADGKYCIILDNYIYVYTTNNGELLYEIEGFYDLAAVSFDSRKVIAAEENTLLIWDIIDGTLLNTFYGLAADIENITTSPDGSLVAATAEEAIIIWNTDGGVVQYLQQEESYGYDLNKVMAVAISPDNRTILVSRRTDFYGYDFKDHAGVSMIPSNIEIWDIESGNMTGTITGAPIRQDAYIDINLPGNVMLSSGYHKDVILWDINTCETLSCLNMVISGTCGFNI